MKKSEKLKAIKKEITTLWEEEKSGTSEKNRIIKSDDVDPIIN